MKILALIAAQVAMQPLLRRLRYARRVIAIVLSVRSRLLSVPHARVPSCSTQLTNAWTHLLAHLDKLGQLPHKEFALTAMQIATNAKMKSLNVQLA